MIERLLIPSWNTPVRSVDDWNAELARLGHPPEVAREGSDELWLVLERVGARLLAVVEGPTLTAWHAEIDAEDPAPALAVIDQAAAALGWEVHDEDLDEDEDDENDR
ncbi:hypothetical protein [Tautonia sociabilis]|uniref:Uncharacterized protein n=1 Tax=Tautonia sociabilis TaxID=2080755 RepID=A0A432MQQ9_9BACT|nr:hypothetical protein [Tautonia sociabilis]RUL89782.1 hypothetical protein TsocGM_01050 [Tautonia sociabilis]